MFVERMSLFRITISQPPEVKGGGGREGERGRERERERGREGRREGRREGKRGREREREREGGREGGMKVIPLKQDPNYRARAIRNLIDQCFITVTIPFISW